MGWLFNTLLGGIFSWLAGLMTRRFAARKAAAEADQRARCREAIAGAALEAQSVKAQALTPATDAALLQALREGRMP